MTDYRRICCSKDKEAGTKHLLHIRMTFSQSLAQVMVGMSKLGYTGLIFVDSGVKVDEAYYYDLLLLQQLLPAIRQVYSEFIFYVQRFLTGQATYRPR